MFNELKMNIMNIAYSTLSSNFGKVKDLPTSAVGKLIGGKVEENIKAGFFTNACAIRLSYAFNYSGMPISRYDGATSSGKDKKWYLYRVTDMLSFIKQKIGGTPIKGKKLEDFKGKKGIIIFRNCNWSDASGHVDLFNGEKVEGKAYFTDCGNVELYVLQ